MPAGSGGGEWQRRFPGSPGQLGAVIGCEPALEQRYRQGRVRLQRWSQCGLQRCGGAMAQGCDTPKQPFWVYLTELVAKKCLLFHVFATK